MTFDEIVSLFKSEMTNEILHSDATEKTKRDLMDSLSDVLRIVRETYEQREK